MCLDIKAKGFLWHRFDEKSNMAPRVAEETDEKTPLMNGEVVKVGENRKRKVKEINLNVGFTEIVK